MGDESTTAVAEKKALLGRIEERLSDQGKQYRQRIRRCFMTGKQCTFCGQAATQTRELPNSIFVVMPFRPGLDAFYEWSLKPLLAETFDMGGDQIRRGDEYRNLGYVMCEKICRRIQQAKLVVVDLSVVNSNVFYELGLAIGLSKPLLVICDQERAARHKAEFWRSLGIAPEHHGQGTPGCVLTYVNVSRPQVGEPDIERMAVRVELEPLNPAMKIVMLPVSEPRGKRRNRAAAQVDAQDLAVAFDSAVETAVEVAIRNLEAASARDDSLRNAIDILRSARGKGQELFETDQVGVMDSEGKPASFTSVTEAVNSAFTCIIDLEGENPHAYFWLGYCHARGVNVIPVYRDSALPAAGPEDGVVPAGGERGTVLAFDIRALWYMNLKPNELNKLAGAFQGVLEELIVRDVPRLQRNTFWERLTRTPRIYIYTGAVHHGELGREMVGDWDLRTASELVRYLASEEESVIPEQARPIYSPGTVRDKLLEDGVSWDDRKLSAFVELIKGELADKNCLIIASADVNPLTEVVLAEAYGLEAERTCFHRDHKPANKDDVVVALKEIGPDGEDDGSSLLPFFAGTARWAGSEARLEKENRGFLVDRRAVQLPYRSQDSANQPFSVLAHLVIMRNPFVEQQPSDKMLVILNGVSGPGTFGLAEVLTGGTSSESASNAERLLQRINESWNECQATKGKRGVEAIIEVTIEPAPLEDQRSDQAHPMAVDDTQQVEEKFYDKRRVVKWDWWDAGQAEGHIRGGNPRVFPV